MGKKIISQDVLDMLYLISCALHGTTADSDIACNFNLKNIFALSVDQSLTSVTYMGIDRAVFVSDEQNECLNKWDKCVKQALRKNLLLDNEREKLFAYMEENKIWHMPLKGAVLQEMYPVYGMRQMSDNDILFDETRRADVREYMEKNGFETHKYGESAHDVYMKPPIFNFEMHVELFGSNHDPDWRRYYSNVKERLVLTEGSSYKYQFTDEDFYIYQIMHAYKHYRRGGCGLRHLLDTYIFLSAKGASLNRDYVLAELDKLGARDYSLLTEELCSKIFSEPHHFTVDEINDLFTSEELDMLYVLNVAGTYGSHDSKVEAYIKKSEEKSGKSGNKKMNYYLSRIFPDDEWWRFNVPFCYRHPWAKPFYNIYRMVRGLTWKRKILANEIKIVNNEMKEDE